EAAEAAVRSGQLTDKGAALMKKCRRPDGSLRLTPRSAGSDGFFIAAMRRVGGFQWAASAPARLALWSTHDRRFRQVSAADPTLSGGWARAGADHRLRQPGDAADRPPPARTQRLLRDPSLQPRRRGAGGGLRSQGDHFLRRPCQCYERKQPARAAGGV